MPANERRPSRRQLLQTFGALGAVATLESNAAADASPAPAAAGFREELARKIEHTTFADTHEHLPDESERLRGEGVPSDDWASLLSHYIDSDLVTAGMPEADLARMKSHKVEPLAKWPLVAPYWPAVRHTGYGQMVRITLRELYGIDDLNEKTVPQLQKAYEAVRKPGFYKKILADMCRIESCQVNGSGTFKRSQQPTFLLQDIAMVGMHIGPNIKAFSDPAGKTVNDLADWHAVIDWWFDTYGSYAVAVKNSAAYFRGLDYERVTAEQVEAVFKKTLQRDPVSPDEKKALEDHLFWYAVDQATTHDLPVKLHTGYYYGHNKSPAMPLGRLAGNPAEATELCRKGPNTQFVFMHIAYPYWQALIAATKHYTNAHIDMCWAAIMDPLATVQFLKSALTTLPSNKLFVFGGDLIPVECVVGHAHIARKGLGQALAELVDEGWLGRNDALELVEPLMHGNARRFFRLAKKIETLKTAPWAK